MYVLYVCVIMSMYRDPTTALKDKGNRFFVFAQSSFLKKIHSFVALCLFIKLFVY